MLTEELIESDAFIHCFLSVAEAALRTERADKIVCFANLLTGTVDGRVESMDDFEEFYSILDDLSPREMVLLATLERHPDAATGYPSPAPTKSYGERWQVILDDLAQASGVSGGQIVSALYRLERSGLYKGRSGGVGGGMDFAGVLTSTWPNFKRAILVEERRLTWPFAAAGSQPMSK